MTLCATSSYTMTFYTDESARLIPFQSLVFGKGGRGEQAVTAIRYIPSLSPLYSQSEPQDIEN